MIIEESASYTIFLKLFAQGPNSGMLVEYNKHFDRRQIMKNTLTLALVTFSTLVTACGAEQPSDSFSVSDESLRPVVGEFYESCRNLGNEDMKAACFRPAPVTVKLVDSLPYGADAAYYQSGEIHVKKDLTGYALKKTIWHELAHHTFNVDNVSGNENCGEILYSGDTCIRDAAMWDAAVKNLFSL